MLKKLLLLFLYVFYGVVLTAILLVVRFPEDVVLAKMSNRIEQAFPGFSCRISNVSYSYPYSVRLDSVVLNNSSDGTGGISFENVLFTMIPEQLLNQFQIHFRVLEGTVGATIALLPGNEVLELRDIIVNDVDLSKITYFQADLQRTVAGRFDCSGTYAARRDDLIDGEFAGSLVFRDFRMDLKRPILQNEFIDFSKLTVKAEFKNSMIELAEGSATGSLLDSIFSGTVAFGPQWQDATLDITGTINPKQDYLQKNPEVARSVALLRRKYRNSAIPYRLSGSFQVPIFQFGSASQ